MSDITPMDLKTVDIVQVSPDKFSEMLIAGKKTKASASKEASTNEKKRSKSKPASAKRAETDYCFDCKSLTQNKSTVVNSPYRLSKCAKCNSDKKAFVNP